MGRRNGTVVAATAYRWTCTVTEWPSARTCLTSWAVPRLSAVPRESSAAAMEPAYHSHSGVIHFFTNMVAKYK